MLLPLEIIIDILTRLPVTSLLRFRCVSKTFCFLIDGKDFINQHLNRSIETNSNHSLIISLAMWNPESRIYSFSLEFDSLDSCLEIARPFRECMFDVIGSCNGLLAMQNCQEGIILLNPLTKKHREIPNFFGDLSNCIMGCLDGFGYDVYSDDYKLVRITLLGIPVHHTEATVYSLKNNSWRKIKDFPYHFCVKRGSGAFVNGALHWVANLNPEGFRDDLMIAFDLKSEEFYEMPMPTVGNGGMFSGVEVLRGCLALVCINDAEQPWDIWVMKEYGVKDSWTKLFSLTGEVVDSCDYLKALAYSRSGDKVLVVESNGVLYWYDLEKQRVENGIEIDVQGIANCDNAIVCVDSLVSLDAYTRNR